MPYEPIKRLDKSCLLAALKDREIWDEVSRVADAMEAVRRIDEEIARSKTPEGEEFVAKTGINPEAFRRLLEVTKAGLLAKLPEI